MVTHPAPLRSLAVALATIGLVALGGAPAFAAGQYPTADPAFTQSLYGTANAFLGGVAFAPDGSPLVDECSTGGSPLHRFDANTLLPATNGTSTLHAASVLPSNAGCGLTNHPDGTLYSNTATGLANLDATTGAWIRTIGRPGSAFGVTVDPQTDRLVYVAADCGAGPTCSLLSTDPVTNVTTTFAALPSTESTFVDGMAFDPTGNFLFLSNRLPLSRVTILDRTGTVVQDVPMLNVPDGIAFHVQGTPFVLVNDNSGALDRLDFPLNDYALPPVVTMLASGGFRGDMSQVGPDGCMYVTQDGTRYDNGVTAPSDSLVRVCPGFAPQPGVGGDITGHAVALRAQTPVTTVAFADTPYVATDAASSFSTSAVSATAATVTAGVLNASVVTALGPARSRAEASVASVTATAGAVTVQATGVVSTSGSDCGGSTGESEIASLTVVGVPIVLSSVGVAPNTVVPLPGGGAVTLNEQIETVTPATGSRVLTVNAVHVVIPGLLDLVVASATSDIHHCPA